MACERYIMSKDGVAILSTLPPGVISFGDPVSGGLARQARQRCRCAAADNFCAGHPIAPQGPSWLRSPPDQDHPSHLQHCTFRTWTTRSKRQASTFHPTNIHRKTSVLIIPNRQIRELDLKRLLYQLFLVHGKVIDVIVKKGKMRGQAFVVFR
jgi:hypothetical protein